MKHCCECFKYKCPFYYPRQVFREIERGGRLTDPSSSMLYNIYKEFWEHEPEKRMPIHLGLDKLQK